MIRRRRIGKLQGVRAGIALAVAMALALPGSALGYTNTGGSTSGNVSGYWSWCDDICHYWSSTAVGSSIWHTAMERSEGETWYQIAPFQQSVLLHNGVDAWSEGLSPYAYWFSDIYNSSGTKVISGFRASSGICWSAAYGQYDLFWVGCSTSGFSISTSAYPPGTAKGYFQITDAVASPGFARWYSGSLR